MKSQVKPGWAAAFVEQLLGAVLADERDAAARERVELLGRQVLHRREDLDLAGPAAGGREALVDDLQVGADILAR